MPFSNPIVGGSTLVRPAIQSPNYVAGSSGWSINADGSAEFGNAIIRGVVQQLLRIITGNVGAQALGIRDNLDTFDRLTIRTDGLFGWGTGGAPTDTDLYRIAAGVLATDGGLQVLGGILSLLNGPHGQNSLQIGYNGATFPTTAIDTDADVFFGSGTSAADTAFGRATAGTLYADPIVALLRPSITAETWHSVTFTAALWGNRGAGFPPFSYRMVPSPARSLQITGQMQPNGGATADGTILGNLAAPYRPVTAHLIRMRTGAGTSGLLQLGTNGDLVIFDCAGNTLMQIIDTVVPLDI